MFVNDNLQGHRSWRFLDEIFVWGIILAPMTALRIWKFGPGEVLLIIWMLAVFFGNNSSSKYPTGTLPISDIGKYQLTNLGMMLIGMVVNAALYRTVIDLGDTFTNLFSHLFMFFISSCMVLYFENRSVDDINKVIGKIVIAGCAVNGLLLLYGTYISMYFLGDRLWIGNRIRFDGLSLNPHQIGMATGVGVFFSLYLMSSKNSLKSKIGYLFTAIIWFWVSLALKSDTLTISYVILAAMLVFLKVLKGTDDVELRKKNNIVIVFVVCIALVIAAPQIWDKFVDFISGAGNGLGRIELWQSGLGQFQEKVVCLFTGLGPSAGTGMFMASGNQAEAHNTYIQQILNGGIFVCIYYFLTIFRLVKKPIEKNTYLVMAVMYFVLYGFGGNMNRRVLVWFTYTIVMLLNEKTKDMEIAQK